MFRNYLKIAWRSLTRYKSYSVINVTGLMAGMAGGILLFLFVHYHLSTDRYQANFDRLVRFSTDLHLEDGSIEYNAEGPPPLAKTLRTNYPQVEQAAFLLGMRDLNVSFRRPDHAQPTRFLEHEGVGFVEPEWLDVVTYTWLRGNPETALRAPNQVVLTESWATRYFGTTHCLGQTIFLNNKAMTTVVGVVTDPPGPTDTPVQMLVSLPTMYQVGVSSDMGNDWSALNSINRVYARLKNPNAISSLQRAMPALSKKQYGAVADVYQFVIQPFADLHTDVARDPAHAIRPSLLWSLGLIGVLLVIVGCINFVNLATVQALRRSKEVGIRKTLGSSRGQLVRQFLLETSLIVGLATGLGLVLTRLSLPIFNVWVQLPLTLRFDWLTIRFVSLLFLSVLLLAGAYPAFVLSGFSPWAALTSRLRTVSTGKLPLRRMLVVMQFGVCQILLLAALIVTRQTRYMQQADPGFTKDNVVMVDLPYNQKIRHDAFKRKLLTYAGIQSVSLSVLPPSSRLAYGGSFKFDGKPDWEKYPVDDRLADADYLNTYGLHLLAGRTITPGDTIRDYVINETLMHKLGFQKPELLLGRRLQHYLSAVPLPIVGVVKDFHQKSLRDEIMPCVIANWPAWYRTAGIRLSGQYPAQTISQIEQIWQQIFPDEVFTYQFLDNEIARLYKTEKMIVRLVSAFSVLVILIGCLGLYGLVSYVVVQRTKEIGVRKVLGASITSIVALLSKDFLKLVLIAVVIASPLAWYAMSKWLEGFAYKIDIAWWYFALAGLLAIGIALLTVSFQSVKAALMNPVKSLRSE